MTCKVGGLVLIPFPYSHLESTKRRPVLILTSPDRHGDFICLAITSVPQTEEAIKLETSNLLKGRLPKTSWVRLDKVFTLSESIIVKHFGQVDKDFINKVLEGLCGIVGYGEQSNVTHQ